MDHLTQDGRIGIAQSFPQLPDEISPADCFGLDILRAGELPRFRQIGRNPLPISLCPPELLHKPRIVHLCDRTA
ncbi:MAG: hypothetical protein ACYTG0_37710 [Planctomycetota bacterium]|jgi:hypothetical protein